MTGARMGAHAELAAVRADRHCAKPAGVGARAGRRDPLRRQHRPALPARPGRSRGSGCWSTAPRVPSGPRPSSSPTSRAPTSPACAATATPTWCARSAPRRSSTTPGTGSLELTGTYDVVRGHRRQPRPPLGSPAAGDRRRPGPRWWPASPTSSSRAATSVRASPRRTRRTSPGGSNGSPRASEGGRRPHPAAQRHRRGPPHRRLRAQGGQPRPACRRSSRATARASAPEDRAPEVGGDGVEAARGRDPGGIDAAVLVPADRDHRPRGSTSPWARCRSGGR